MTWDLVGTNDMANTHIFVNNMTASKRAPERKEQTNHLLAVTRTHTMLMLEAFKNVIPFFKTTYYV
jgi:hypothetical protein